MEDNKNVTYTATLTQQELQQLGQIVQAASTGERALAALDAALKAQPSTLLLGNELLKKFQPVEAPKSE